MEPELDLTYPEVGATERGPLPAGYHHLRRRRRIGHGPEAFAAAGAAVTGWRMHRTAGIRVATPAARAEPGLRVTVGIGAGPLRIAAPCQVIWTVHDAHRIGFGYGTLPGHVAHGEEAFLVELDPEDGTVWFTITAFSRPARWYTRLAGPLFPVSQKFFARRCARALRRLTAQPPTTD